MFTRMNFAPEEPDPLLTGSAGWRTVSVLWSKIMDAAAAIILISASASGRGRTRADLDKAALFS